MPNRDFFDEDLIKPRAEGGQIRLGPVGEAPPADPDARGDIGGSGTGDIELPLIARHRQQVEAEAAERAREIERLRQLQENLEREKRELEDLRRKQSLYEQGKREMLERLQQSLVALERHELRTAQLTELLQDARRRFREIEAQIRSIQEDQWPEAQIRDELTKALALIEDARMDYNRTMARIEALLGEQGQGAAPAVELSERAPRSDLESRTFGQWVAIGFAASLPLILALLLLSVVVILALTGHI